MPLMSKKAIKASKKGANPRMPTKQAFKKDIKPSTANKINDQTKSLLSLPPELRLKVYSHYFSSASPTTKNSFAIMEVCPLIREEAAPLYMARVTQVYKEKLRIFDVAKATCTIPPRMMGCPRCRKAACVWRPYREYYERAVKTLTAEGFPVGKWLEKA